MYIYNLLPIVEIHHWKGGIALLQTHAVMFSGTQNQLTLFLRIQTKVDRRDIF